MRGADDADKDDRDKRGDTSCGMDENAGKGYEGKDKQRFHACIVRVLGIFVDKIRRHVTSHHAEHGDEVDYYDEQDAGWGVGVVSIGVGQIGRSPEEIEPPYSVSHEFSEDDVPGLFVFQALQHPDSLPCPCLFYLPLLWNVFYFRVLTDVAEFGLVD